MITAGDPAGGAGGPCRCWHRLDALRQGEIIDSTPFDMLPRAQDGVLVSVRVIPRSGRSGLAGTRDGAVLVRLNAAPVDGAANAELIELIANAIGVPKRAVSIASGSKSRGKTVRVTGVSEDVVRMKLLGGE
jgi:uncharacterized protein (TIGR00251 family)